MMYLELQKFLAKKPQLTLVEVQQVPTSKKTDSKEEVFCLKWTF